MDMGSGQIHPWGLAVPHSNNARETVEGQGSDEGLAVISADGKG